MNIASEGIQNAPMNGLLTIQTDRSSLLAGTWPKIWQITLTLWAQLKIARTLAPVHLSYFHQTKTGVNCRQSKQGHLKMIPQAQGDLYSLFNGSKHVRENDPDGASNALSVLVEFEELLVKKIESYLKSGAVSEDITPEMLTRVAIAILAEENYRPRMGAKQSRSLYNNLVHF